MWPAQRAYRASKARLGYKVPRACKVPLVFKGIRACKAFRARLGYKVPLGSPDRLELLALLGYKGTRGFKAKLGCKALRACRVQQVLLGKRACKVCKGLQVYKAAQV